MPAPRRKRRYTFLLYVLGAVVVAALAMWTGLFRRLPVVEGAYGFAERGAAAAGCPQGGTGPFLDYAAALAFGAGVALLYALLAALTTPQVRARARFALLVAILAGVSLYHWRFPLGIDLAGGAILNYRFDTGEVDRRIDELQEELRQVPTPKAVEEREKKLAELRKKLEATFAEEAKREIEREIDALERPEDVLKQRIANERAKRRGSVEQALTTLRERLDPTGTESLTIARRGEYEFTVEVPMPRITRRTDESFEEYLGRKAARFRDYLEKRIKPVIERQGILNFHEVILETDPAVAEARKTGVPPAGHRFVPVRPDRKGGERADLLVVEKPAMGGEHVHYSYAEPDTESGGGWWAISLTLTGPGGHAFDALARRLYDADESKAGRVAIVLDDVVQSDPRFRSQHFGGRVRIYGSFKKEEARTLAKILNAGSLKLKALFLSESVIGPSLGDDQIRRGLRAAGIGAAVVLAFMAFYYLFSGLVANLALVLNLLFILGAMAFLNAPLTLPGLAGIVLTIGMAVDANVLINERIREEKARGRALRLAVQAGYERALVTIIDANVTTLITAYILYLFGSGPVRGFAVTLCLGLIASMFTAIFVTRIVVDLAIGRGWAKELRMLRLFGRSHVPFLRLAPVLVLGSVLVLGGGAYSLVTAKRERLWGIDFLGGSETQLKFTDSTRIDAVREGIERVRVRLTAVIAAAHAGAAAEGGENAGFYDGPEWRVLVEACRKGELPLETDFAFSVQAFQPTGPGQSREFLVVTLLNETQVRLLKLQDVFRAEFVGRLDANDPIPRTATVGRQVADEMLGKAAMALLFSLVAIFFYIVFRFEFNPAFGLAAIVALCHDTLIALAACVVLQVRIDLTIIAALLTVVGYSLNDTIIVFDRIRENRTGRRPFGEVADESLNQVLGRTVLTSVTTLAALVALLVWGGGVIRGFAVVMTVGVLVGTYSSIFIATPFVALWERVRAGRIGRAGGARQKG